MAPREEDAGGSKSSKHVHFRNRRFESSNPSRRTTCRPEEVEPKTKQPKPVPSQDQEEPTPERVSVVPPFDSDIPVATGGQQIFTHYTNTSPPAGFYQHNFAQFGQASPQIYAAQAVPAPLVTSQPISIATYPHLIKTVNMGDYENTGNMDRGVHFQPQVPDTSFGPHVHTFVPSRPDNGVVFIQQVANPQHPGVLHMQPAPAAIPVHQVPGGAIPVVASTASGGTPIIVQQPVPQPAMVHPIPVQGNVMPGSHPIMVNNAPPAVPINVAGQAVFPEPALGMGPTAGDIMMQHVQFAQENNLFEPQDFKPADDDPSRIYMVRELDGNWTQRNRFTIDHLGCRWYLTDEGYFYAVRLPN